MTYNGRIEAMKAVYGKFLYIRLSMYAEVARSVEHNLAKVGVASSSLVFRSKFTR